MNSFDVPERAGLRVVVLTCGELGFDAAKAISELTEVECVTVVCTPYRQPERSAGQKLMRGLRYDGLFATMASGWHRLLRPARAAEPIATSPADSGSGFEVLTFPDFHDEACIRALTALRADLGVVVGTYILQPSVFEIPRRGSINLHTGKAPEYRGSAPVFWELFNGETEVGITIHSVTRQLDAGTILHQETVPIDPATTGDPGEYIEWLKAHVLGPRGIRVLAETVQQIARGTATPLEQDGTRAVTYRMPTYAQKRELYRRVRQRRGHGLNQRAKDVIGILIFRSGLYRALLRGRAFIILFHRVDDRYLGNAINCSEWEFERYCAFFGRYFDVISATELTDLVERGQDVTGKLVITFDDGYIDNLAAGRTMLRHRLPGCFFIASNFIGTDRDGWWDVQERCRSEWMSWDDVRQLHEWGFEIGAHTRDHVDLGLADERLAETEIVGSRADLEAQLGSPVTIFAYPFGGLANLTPGNHAIIRKHFRSSMSAYGGTVTASSSPHDLPRVSVSDWFISPWHFAVDLLLGRHESPPGEPVERGRHTRRRVFETGGSEEQVAAPVSAVG